MKLFISYSHVDVGIVKQLVELLRASGLDPWFDHRLLVGRKWEDQLYEAIQQCDEFVFTLSPESVVSEWCLWEFSQAVSVGKPIVPILLQANTKIPSFLSQYQYADFSEGVTPEGIARLMGGIFSTRVIIRAAPANLPQHPTGTPAQATPIEGQTTQGLIGNTSYNTGSRINLSSTALLSGFLAPVSSAVFVADNRLIVTTDFAGRVINWLLWDQIYGLRHFDLPHPIHKAKTRRNTVMIMTTNGRMYRLTLQQLDDFFYKMQKDYSNSTGDVVVNSANYLFGQMLSRSIPEFLPLNWKEIPNPPLIADFDLTFDASLVACAFDDGVLRLFDLLHGRYSNSLGLEKYDFGSHMVEAKSSIFGLRITQPTKFKLVSLSPTGRFAITCNHRNQIALWSLKEAKPQNVYTHNHTITALDCNHDGRLLAIGDDSGQLTLIETPSLKPVHHLKLYTSAMATIKFSPDGQWIALGNEDGQLAICWAKAGSLSHQLVGHTDRISEVNFSSDSTQVISASWDKTVRLWSLRQ